MRTHQRLDYKEPIKFEALSLDPAGEELGRQGTGQNISMTGIYFEVKNSDEIQRHMKVGNIIWVAFTLPTEKDELRTQCEIRRVLDLSKNKVGLGAMFINLSTKAERAIVNFLR